MYILNLARAYRENSGENTWREMFLCFTVGMKLIPRRKKFKKKYNFRRKCSNNTKQLQTA